MRIGIYIFDDMESFKDADLEVAYGKVSPRRRSKALSYVYGIDRKLSVIAELLLKFAIRRKYDILHLPEMTEGYHGKPAFTSEVPHFNLSHCRLAVACAVSDAEIGVDVEQYDSYDEDVAHKVFNEKEMAGISHNPQRFAKLWTVKESYLKFTGEGLTDNLPALLNDASNAYFHTFHNPKGYACTVCGDYKELIDVQPVYIDKKSLLNG